MRLMLTESGLKGRIALVVGRGVYAETKGNRYINTYRKRVECIRLVSSFGSLMHTSTIRDNGEAKVIAGGEG